jgi:hypothetical protein
VGKVGKVDKVSKKKGMSCQHCFLLSKQMSSLQVLKCRVHEQESNSGGYS